MQLMFETLNTISDISEAECVESLQDIKNGVDPL